MQLPGRHSCLCHSCVFAVQYHPCWPKTSVTASCAVLATNWSGPTAFLDDCVGYPLAIDGLAPASGAAFAGHKWAAPSVAHLQSLMRQVISHPDRAKKKGRWVWLQD